MKLKLILIFLIIFTRSAAIDYEFDGELQLNKPYLFVSLGCNCWIAQALRAFDLRDAAFPFDWLLTPDTAGLIRCLNEEFENYHNESCLLRYENIHLHNTYYDFKFTHDWPPFNPQQNEAGFKQHIDFLKTKHNRRIARFMNLKKYKGKLFFIRCFQVDPTLIHDANCNAENAHLLHAALKSFFPEVNFGLVIVSCTHEGISEVGIIDTIKEFKIRELTENNFAAYGTMFHELLHEFNF